MNTIQKLTTVVVTAFLVVGLGSGAQAGSKPPVRGKLVHPCDVAAGIKSEKKTEELCLKVWAQPWYVSGPTESPAGPVVVSELRDQIEWTVQHEGVSRKTAEAEFARGLAYERKAYLGRKK